eukprot:1373643-Rhodomonas_salina.2
MATSSRSPPVLLSVSDRTTGAAAMSVPVVGIAKDNRGRCYLFSSSISSRSYWHTMLGQYRAWRSRCVGR